MAETNERYELLNIASKIVCAYVGNNPVEISEIPAIVNKVYDSVQDIARFGTNFRKTGPLVPSVPIAESVTDDYIVCLEDGKKLQMLKRHLNTVYKMSVEEYKERWGLNADYPIVAPNYARRRSQIARNTGLGQTGRKKRVRFDQTTKDGITKVAAIANK